MARIDIKDPTSVILDPARTCLTGRKEMEESAGQTSLRVHLKY